MKLNTLFLILILGLISTNLQAFDDNEIVESFLAKPYRDKGLFGYVRSPQFDKEVAKYKKDVLYPLSPPERKRHLDRLRLSMPKEEVEHSYLGWGTSRGAIETYEAAQKAGKDPDAAVSTYYANIHAERGKMGTAPTTLKLETLSKLLHNPHETTQKAILDYLYELKNQLLKEQQRYDCTSDQFKANQQDLLRTEAEIAAARGVYEASLPYL